MDRERTENIIETDNIYVCKEKCNNIKKMKILLKHFKPSAVREECDGI